MITSLDSSELVQFEQRVANAFNAGLIRAPVHLYSGNENKILEIFETINEEDWVLCSWRSHYQCLLKGVPEEELFNEILDGRSISLCFPDHKILCSAMVGGILPIATGIAFGIKNRNMAHRVHCFLGDMTSETGIAHECIKYSCAHDLPIRFIIENDGKSVCTNTLEAWGLQHLTYSNAAGSNIEYYEYVNTYPHSGAGVRVQF